LITNLDKKKIMKILKYIVISIFSIYPYLVFSVEPQKLLMPGESFKNPEQKRFEISNYKQSGINYYEWRKRKCYKRSFVLFQRSKLCYHDPHFCAQDFAVEEMHFFHKYRRWLMDLAGVCAEGYLINEEDTKIIKQPLQKEVDAFIKYIRETKEKVNYDDTSSAELETDKNKQKNELANEKKSKKNQGAHGAVPVPENKTKKKKPPLSEKKPVKNEIKKTKSNEVFDEKEMKKRRKNLEEEEKRILLEKKILESEIEIMKKRKRLEKLKSEIEASEKKLLKKKEEIVEE